MPILAANGRSKRRKWRLRILAAPCSAEKIELIDADHQNKPDLATAIARRGYDAEGVDMITDLTSSAVALGVQQIAGEKKKIDIVVGAATSALTGSAYTPFGPATRRIRLPPTAVAH